MRVIRVNAYIIGSLASCRNDRRIFIMIQFCRAVWAVGTLCTVSLTPRVHCGCGVVTCAADARN